MHDDTDIICDDEHSYLRSRLRYVGITFDDEISIIDYI